MSATEMSAQQVPIRLVFLLHRLEDPHLYDDLIRFAKGTKRVNRLRMLAHDGSAVEAGRGTTPSPPAAGQDGAGGLPVDTNDLFPHAKGQRGAKG
jgi:hypothetical protein